MIDILVVGLGNSLLGDDGLGVEVISRLRTRSLQPRVELLDGGTAGLYLLPHLEGRSHILVVDAVDIGGRPGQLVRLQASEIPTRIGLKLSEHQVTFCEVLALMDLVGVAPAEFLLLGVQARSRCWGDPLSPEVEAAISRATEEIMEQLARWRRAAEPAA